MFHQRSPPDALYAPLGHPPQGASKICDRLIEDLCINGEHAYPTRFLFHGWVTLSSLEQTLCLPNTPSARTVIGRTLAALIGFKSSPGIWKAFRLPGMTSLHFSLLPTLLRDPALQFRPFIQCSWRLIDCPTHRLINSRPALVVVNLQAIANL